MLTHISKKTLFLFVGDALLIIISLFLSSAIMAREILNVFSLYTGASVISLFFYLFVFYMADIYNFQGRINGINFILRLIIAIIISNCLIAATFYVFHKWNYSRSVFFLSCFLVLFYSVSWRLIFYRLLKVGKMCSEILIRGSDWVSEELNEVLEKNYDYKLVGLLEEDVKNGEIVSGSSSFVEKSGGLVSLLQEKITEKLMVPIMAGPYLQFGKKGDDTRFHGVKIYDIPTFYEYITGKIPLSQISDNWLYYSHFYKKNKHLYNLKIKIVLEKILAVLILMITLPLIIVSAIAIKLDSRGSVFFIQARRGEGIKTIKIVKFRTMFQGMEEERERAGFRNDPRITRVGKILRFFRIDEIPQLWNVIKGDMSIIGPRTLMMQEVSRFSNEIPYFYIRQFVKPGITGWAQVNYKHGVNIEDATEKLQYDLYYIKNLSPLLDFHILLLTLKVVLLGRGAR